MLESSHLQLVERLRNPITLAAALLGFSILYVIGSACFNIYLHPLAKYPGPKVAAASRIWFCFHTVRGRLPFVISELHNKYGDVVRVAPNELSYAAAEGWNQIYGYRHGKSEIPKDPTFYSSLSSRPESILNAPLSRHGQLRKSISHGFSERALRGQEDVIRGYADRVVERMKGFCDGASAELDMVRWYNFFTFDTMGALTFGESFDCIKNADWHPLIKVIFDGTKIGYYLLCSKYWPLLAPIVQYLIVPKELKDHRKEQSRLTKKKTDRRKSMKPENADLISGMLQEDSAATEEEYHATAATLIAAGGETTATLLSGVTYFLLTNPDCMRRVVDEVRESFGSVSNISYVNVNKLSYLLACLNEAFRMYPPVADAFPRNTSSNTEVICGKAVPPNTVVRMTQYATYRNPANFARPNEFLPERWLDAEENGNKTSEFLKDKRGALQPFHVGPRNCIGQNLAYFEMRLMMALLLWNFDMELLPESEGWMDQKSYLFWEKSDLMVRLTPRVQ